MSFAAPWPQRLPAISKSPSHPRKPSKSRSILSCRTPGSIPSIYCTLTRDPAVVTEVVAWQRRDSFSRFGKFGGKYVPETLMCALSALETAFQSITRDEECQEELDGISRDYAGRESPLNFAEPLSDHYREPNGEGPHVYLERENHNHNGAHNINDPLAQALLAKRLGKRRIIAETGAGQHGAALIGKEIRQEARDKWGGKPEVLVARGGSNAIELSHELVEGKDVRLIGAEAAEFGLDSGEHAATMTNREAAVLHRSIRNLPQDDDGQIIEPSAGLDYPGLGPEHSFLRDIGRIVYGTATNREALEALTAPLHGSVTKNGHPFFLATVSAGGDILCLGLLRKFCPVLPDGTKIVLYCQADRELEGRQGHPDSDKISTS